MEIKTQSNNTIFQQNLDLKSSNTEENYILEIEDLLNIKIEEERNLIHLIITNFHRNVFLCKNFFNFFR